MSDVNNRMESQTLAMKRKRTASRNPKMERCRSEEDVLSSDEPDPKRHKRDNLGSTTRKRESNLKNVLVLTSRDVRKRDGKVFMPNTIEMAQLKKPERERFKTKIKLPKTMTVKNVEAELRRQFPVLRKDGRFYCGTLVENRTRMEFHDIPPTVWDGTKINRRVRGNSALYVYFEETSESPEPQTVDSIQQQLQTPMPEPMGSPPSHYSEKLKSLKSKHDPSSSLVPEVVSSTEASVKKQEREGTRHEGKKEGEQQSPLEQQGYHRDNSTTGLLCNSGTFQKTQNQQIGLEQSDRSKEPQVVTEDSAYETAARDASDVDDNTKHSKGNIKEAPWGVVARIADYLQNSKVDPSEGSSLEEIDSIRIHPHDQVNLSDGEYNEMLQDVLTTLFGPVITKLCPKEGPITGGTEFVICLNVNGIPANVTSLRARFKGVGFADLTLVTEGVYSGNSPASEILGKVAVTVGSLDDTWNSPDETEFEYHPNVTQELQKLLSKMPDTKRNIPLDDQALNPSRPAGTVCSSSSFSSYVGDRSSLADERQDISSLKALQCILFAAAATNDRECVEIIFSTSAGEAVFQTYRNSSILPEDTARARGNQNLAEYLQNVHKRLSEEIDCNVQTVTIDWVELKRATAQKNICSGADEFQPMEGLETVSLLESDDDRSGYFADDETSVCQSPSTSEFSNEDQYIESKYTDDAEMLEHLRSCDDYGDQFEKLNLSSALDKVFDSVNQVKSVNGAANCRAIHHSQESVGFTVTAPLSEDKNSMQRLDNPFIQKKVEDRKAAQEETSKNHEELHDSEVNFTQELAISALDLQAHRAKGMKLHEKEEEVPEKGAKIEENDKKEKENEGQVLEEQLQTEVSPFCILPSVPTHDLAPWRFEVEENIKKLRSFIDSDSDNLKILNLQGIPGYGKTPLACLVAKRFFDERKENPSATSFVMTLNAESSQTLLKSYISFVRHCKFPEYAVTNIHCSKHLSTNEKIARFLTLISARIKLYTSWLLVIDNVTSLSRVHTFLPDPENQQWVRDQLLLTTRDTMSIPLSSSSILHLSVSGGMLRDNASSLLKLLSSVTDDNILDFVYDELGDLNQAKDFHDRALEIRLKKLGPDHFGVAWSYNTLGFVYVELGDANRAKDCYERALEIRLKTLGPDDVHVATTYDELGRVHSKLGDLNQAKDFHDRALEIRLKKLGPDHFDVAWSYNTLGFVNVELGDPNRAKDCYERALEIRLKTLGPDHVHVATTYNELGRVHSKLGDLNRAKDCHDRALEICLKELGPEHVDVAMSYHNLGLVHSQLGDLNQAKDCYKYSLDIRLKELGPGHIDVAMSYYNLGLVFSQLGDLDQAKDCHECCLAIRLKELGPGHVDVPMSYHNLGLVHNGLGDLNQAKDCYERYYNIPLKELGSGHVDVAMSQRNLSLVHSQLGDTKHTKDCDERNLDTWLENFEPKHGDVATSYGNVGLLRSKVDDPEQT